MNLDGKTDRELILLTVQKVDSMALAVEKIDNRVDNIESILDQQKGAANFLRALWALPGVAAGLAAGFFTRSS